VGTAVERRLLGSLLIWAQEGEHRGRRVGRTGGAQVNVTKLQVAAAAADAYLTILAAQQTVTAAKAGVERARVLNQIVEPCEKRAEAGAEESRTRAELA